MGKKSGKNKKNKNRKMDVARWGKKDRARLMAECMYLNKNFAQPGFFSNLAGYLPSGRTEQFLLGAAAGIAVTYFLGDEKLRARLLKSGMNLYAGIASGMEELKEQMADLRAEVEAERQDAE